MTLPFEKLDTNSKMQVLYMRLEEVEKKLAELTNLVNGGLLIANKNTERITGIDKAVIDLAKHFEFLQNYTTDNVAKLDLTKEDVKPKSFWDFFKHGT